MAAQVIDGKQLAETIKAELLEQVRAFHQQTGRRPGLAAVLVGDNPASQVYVREKRKACEELGMASWLHQLPATATQVELLRLIDQLNTAAAVHGILVQLPLPPQIAETAVIHAVHPLKDVDCFHPENVGLLAAGHPRYLPCTPHGVQQILIRNRVIVEGAHVVIVGRSNIVGNPLPPILMHKTSHANTTPTTSPTP